MDVTNAHSTWMGPPLPAVSVVIAAYNEQTWLGQTIASVVYSGFPCEVIIVNDGSTDATSDVLAAWADKVRVITHSTNKGKGAAVSSGVRAATGEIVVLCDAHLQGLSYYHLFALVLPLVTGHAREVLGVGVLNGDSMSALLSPLTPLTGQRSYFRADLEPVVDEMENLGYGLEVFLLSRFSRKDRAFVLLPGLVHLLKKDTSPFMDGVKAYVRESLDVAATLLPLRLVPLGSTIAGRIVVDGHALTLRPGRRARERSRERRT